MATTIQELSIAAIVIDPELQPRVKTDMEHVAKLQAVIEEGVSITEPDVFFDEATGIYLMADGFHRHAAHVKLGRPSIRCKVHKGTRRDAMIFATRANVVHTGLMLSAKDKRKAMRMLFLDGVFWNKPNTVAAKHLNVSTNVVKSVRLEVSAETGRPIPESFEGQDGRDKYSRRPPADNLPQPARQAGKRPRYRKYINGAYVYLGDNEHSAREALSRILSEARSRKSSLRRDALGDFLTTRRIRFKRTSGRCVASSIGTRISLRGLTGDGWVAVPETFESPEGFAHSLGAVLWLRAALDVPRAVILCYREDAPAELFPAAESLGVEFLTPDEFVASVKPE